MREWNSVYNPFNSVKVLAWSDRISAIVRDEFEPPVVINLDLVRGCNYRCKYCIWEKRKELKPTMVPFDIARKLPTSFKNWGVKGVCIAGEKGDPSLYPNLHILLREFHKNDIEVGLVSNGYAYDLKTLRAAAHYTKFTGFSVDAGTSESYSKVHGVPEDYFYKVMDNIKFLCRYRDENDLSVEVGFKFLLFPESYDTIYEGAKLAKKLGVRDFQIRPSWIPEKDTERIDLEEVNRQIEKAMGLEDEKFRVFGIRHKFSPDFKKKQVKHCWATPLTLTMTAEGDCHLCVDRRDTESDILCNYIQDGFTKLKELWGKEKHRKIINSLNMDLHNCKRCTNFQYNEIIENVFANDLMDRRMI